MSPLRRTVMGALAFLFLWCSPALAYIDPGTGSVIFGALGYAIAAAAAFFAIMIRPFKMLYRRLFKKEEKKPAKPGRAKKTVAKKTKE